MPCWGCHLWHLAFSFCSCTLLQKPARLLAAGVSMSSPWFPVGGFVGSDIRTGSECVYRIHLTYRACPVPPVGDHFSCPCTQLAAVGLKPSGVWAVSVLSALCLSLLVLGTRWGQASAVSSEATLDQKSLWALALREWKCIVLGQGQSCKRHWCSGGTQLITMLDAM